MFQRHFKFELISSEGKLHDGRVVRAIQVLQSDPGLNLRDLAPMFQLSPSRLRHLFKIQMGMSVTAYAREVRLHRACELLETTHLTVKQIRNEIGISDASNFVYRFKQLFGISPSAYRKKYA